MLTELGVRHEKGQKYKEAVLDFLKAGGPYQFDLFTGAPDIVYPVVPKEKRLGKPEYARLRDRKEHALAESIGLEIL
tara:strand:- start:118 stop:348 length:231 start_codon:yes stop_codon:yes gene_type:complete